MNFSLTNIGSILWVGAIVLLLSMHVQRWYIKEYRLDRMYILLRENFILNFFLPKLRRMRISPKTILTFLLSCVILSALYFFLSAHQFIKLALLSVLIFPSTLIAVLLLKIPTTLYHRFIIFKAKQIIRAHKNLRIIGVTGSYGKSSTKEFIKELLAEKYSVLATAGSKNSDIAAAELILKKLKPSHEILVLEMGAYTRGEIKAICEIAPPQIAVVTGINEQHLELFGSIENTRKAKYEVVEALPSSGLAIFNADNEYTRLMAKQTKSARMLLYGVHKSAHVKIEKLAQSKTKLQFELHYKNEKISISAPLLGTAYSQNLAAAIIVARELKVPTPQIVQKIASLPTPSTALKILGSLHGAKVLDSSFNANPQSLRTALSYMQLYSGKKYVVMMPLIELGTAGKKVHQELGRQLGSEVDAVYLTNSHFIRELKKGVEQAHSKVTVTHKNKNKIISDLEKMLAPDDVVLLLGKESASIAAKLRLS